MGFMFDLFPLFFLAFFGMFIYLFVSTLVKQAKREKKNDASPRLTVEATVVAKRTHVWGRHAHTDYYATFQVASGDRMELEIPYDQFGYLVESDRGQLTFQGTRFLSFDRG